MNLTLWIIAGLLAVVYLASGAGKLIVPKEKLATAPGAGWIEDFSAGSVKAIGALEVLAAVGLVLPALLDIAPVLVPLATLGLVLIMVGAVVTRLRRHETKPMVADLVYLALGGFVAWGRFFSPRVLHRLTGCSARIMPVALGLPAPARSRPTGARGRGRWSAQRPAWSSRWPSALQCRGCGSSAGAPRWTLAA